MNNQTHVSVIYINASPTEVWEALTSSEFTRQYWHNTNIKSDWRTNSPVTFYNQDRSIAVEGIIIESDKPNRLKYSWHVHYNPIAKQETPSTVTFQLEAHGDSTGLTVIHDGFPQDSVVFPQIDKGWIMIMSNLKTLLETGKAMAIS